MKKITAMVLILLLITSSASADVGVRVFINDAEVIAPNDEVTAFISEHGQTVVGARTFLDALKRQGIDGAGDIVVGYCEPNHSSMWGRQLGAADLKKFTRLPNGALRTFFDGAEGNLMDTNGLLGIPVVQYDRTYFPLRALLNWVGITDIKYNEAKREVRVTIPKGTKLATHPENVVITGEYIAPQEKQPETKEERARSNLKHNESLGSVRGYVNGQNREPYCNFKYGVQELSRNGCGVIAIHNAFIILGKGKELRDVVYYHETNGAILDGVFGTNPLESATYFAENNYSVKTSYQVAEFDSIAASSKVSVLTFWNTNSVFDGAHTVALTKNSDGSIDVYNYYGDSKDTKRFDSIAEMLKKGGHVPMVILGVN